MIRRLAVNCTPILNCPKIDGTTLAEMASDQMVMGAVQVLCEFCLLVRQEKHSDLSLIVFDYELKRLYKKTGVFQDKKMSKSTKGQCE
jgi:hypothetical protein